MSRRAFAAVVLCSLGLIGPSCSDQNVGVVVRNLDGPTDVAFACVGDLRLSGGEVVRSAQPLRSCSLRADGEVPEGQEELIPPDVFAFVLQSTRGTIAVVDTLAGVIADSDPFAPGRNAIPIGTLPVGLVSDRSGCFVVSANAGSCDLSSLDVSSAIDPLVPAEVTRMSISNASGEVLRAKPRVIEPGQRQIEEIGAACEGTPQGISYVGFPGCNLVAAIDVSTGTVAAGVRLLADGSAEITDGNVTCPAQCATGAGGGSSGGGVADPDAGQPVEVELSPDGSRLYVGSQNSSIVHVVDLDPETGLPVATQSVELEGDVGVTALTVTDEIVIGGPFTSLGDVGVPFTYAYAIVTDGSVRAIDTDALVECDLQVDPRYLRDITDIEFLGCMPVGDPATPPRRGGANGPGLRLPRDVSPLDLEVVTVANEASATPAPNVMVGTFGFITASDGNTYVMNIDDDNYPDFEEPNDPSLVWMSLALPNRLRDFVQERSFIVLGSCSSPSDDPVLYPPRLSGDVGLGFGDDPQVPESKASLLPDLRRLECAIEQNGAIVDRRSVGELALAAPVSVREEAFPDLGQVFNEDWFVTWEGILSLDAPSVAIDGRPIRSGLMESNLGLVTLSEAGAPFCGMGVEPYDFVELRGCNPARGNEQCSIGETCYVHPETPTAIDSGMCMPTDQIDRLSGPCRDVLVSRRRYTVEQVYAGQMILGERARVLRTTPVAGCDSDEQCQTLAFEETRISSEAHPLELDNGIEPGVPVRAEDFDWACQPDDTRKPGPDKCVMVCEASSDCQPGYVCSSGVCVAGKLPPSECTQALQRYSVRAGEAFAVVGTVTGFLHDQIVDSETGECVSDPDAAATLVGRIPIDPPPCEEGDGFTNLSPNPCTVGEVTTFEEVAPFEPRGQTCAAGTPALRERTTTAVRFANPAFTINLVDLTTQGNLECIGDRAGDLPPYSAVFEDFTIGFTITGGFVPQFPTTSNYDTEFPVRIRRSPDDFLWILDQGDDRNPQRLTRGRVVFINPANAADGFEAGPPLL